MSRRVLPPRRVDVDGEEMVVLSVSEYEHLDASRRQIGARQARLRALTQQLAEATDLLGQARWALAQAPPCAHPSTEVTCLRCRIASVLDPAATPEQD